MLDSLLLAGSRITKPEKSCAQVLQDIRDGHQGEAKCILKAKSEVQWPGIYKQIKEIVGRYGACRELDNVQTKGPMVAVEIPLLPWHTDRADLFQHKGRLFLLITDVYSKASDGIIFTRISSRSCFD